MSDEDKLDKRERLGRFFLNLRELMKDITEVKIRNEDPNKPILLTVANSFVIGFPCVLDEINEYEKVCLLEEKKTDREYVEELIKCMDDYPYPGLDNDGIIEILEKWREENE